MEEKQRMIQEYVPGKQVTLAHIIASPNKEIYTKLGLPDGTSNALGILTITRAKRQLSLLILRLKAEISKSVLLIVFWIGGHFW